MRDVIDTMPALLDRIMQGKLGARENALRAFMTGRLAIRDWPLDDFHIAICADCQKLVTAECYKAPGTPSNFSSDLLMSMRSGSYVCDDCEDAHGFADE